MLISYEMISYELISYKPSAFYWQGEYLSPEQEKLKDYLLQFILTK